MDEIKTYCPKPEERCYCGSGKLYKVCCMKLDKEILSDLKQGVTCHD